MTSRFDVSVFLSVALCLLMCAALLQHLVSLQEPVHARPAKEGRRNTRTRNLFPPKVKVVRKAHTKMFTSCEWVT
jgi:hypothetical protein